METSMPYSSETDIDAKNVQKAVMFLPFAGIYYLFLMSAHWWIFPASTAAALSLGAFLSFALLWGAQYLAKRHDDQRRVAIGLSLLINFVMVMNASAMIYASADPFFFTNFAIVLCLMCGYSYDSRIFAFNMVFNTILLVFLIHALHLGELFKILLLVGTGAFAALVCFYTVRRLFMDQIKLLTDSWRLSEGLLVETNLRKKEAERAREAAESKSRFLSNMSHEIRTPLNGVLGMARALQSSNLSPEDKSKVDIILQCGSHLTTLLNDILDISKIESGKFELHETRCDVEQLIRDTAEIFRANAEEKGLGYRVEGQAPIRFVMVDQLRFRQCLSNLISNAIKFTDAGQVEITFSSRQGSGGRVIVEAAVTDTGVGLSQEQIRRVFDPFVQADEGLARKHEGTGLGLSITQSLVELMQGGVHAMSKRAEGSTFSFWISAPAAAQDETGEARAPAAEGQKTIVRRERALIVDDIAVNRQVARLFLEPLFDEILEAKDGQECLDIMETEAFDVVFLDIHMPVMDGITTLQRLRAHGGRQAQTPIIALTADAMAHDDSRYRELGFDGYIAKPINEQAIERELGRLTDLPTLRPRVPSAAAA